MFPDPVCPVTSRSFSVCVFAAVVLWMSHAKADDSAKVPALAVESMLGKDPGQSRDKKIRGHP